MSCHRVFLRHPRDLSRRRSSAPPPGWLESLGRIVGLGAWLGAVAACTPPKPATEAQLRIRAAFDLACPPYQLAIYALDSRTRGVVGCGRRLTYMEICESPRRDLTCSWRLESQTPTAATGAPPPGGPQMGSPALPPAPAAPAPEPVTAPPAGSVRDFGF